ncbi:DUF1697 domain-containing protein [uncultured Winogradskyella sp.]|uniref:DUF1697 domain-containing protein n=1 Tax=uncultured Winogradskyella sp. TaxID=395353 RepID=UPI002625DDCE|nr:DUF1697 domain-containing protein [uncultured Winogradskyella sp.]
MQTSIALLRGVNVGGHKKMPMADLRELLAKSGLKNVKTYMQTGNIFFQSSLEDNNALESKIRILIADHFGFKVSVIVRTKAQIQTIFNNCPFPEEKKLKSYFAMLSQVPDAELLAEAKEKTYENEEYSIINDAIYFYCAKGYGNAKFSLNYFEKKLKVKATARNYKTMLKLLSLSEN